MTRFVRSLVLALAVPALVACGGSTPAPEATPEASEPVSEATPEAPAAEEVKPFSVVLDAATSTVEWKSIKNGDAPVNGKLTKPTGGLWLTAADLSATRGDLQFDLSGVDSGLELRDQRIAEVFFGATADNSATGQVSLTKLTPEAATLEPGGSTPATADLTVKAKDAEATVQAKVTVTRTDANTWTVVSAEDATVSIKSLGLDEPLDALMKLCAHKSVDDAVGIAVNLTFKAAE